MHIVIVKDALLPAQLYGGTERVIYSLGQSLSSMGHRVSFLCRRGSIAPFATVLPLDPARPVADQVPEDADIVHFHDKVPEGYHRTPYVFTVHGNLANAEERPPMAIFVSKNHALRHGSSHYVLNGLNWDDYPAYDPTAKRRNYHFLGNAAWRVKNVRGAIRIISNIKGAHLDVLGGHRLNLKMGFRLTLNPRIHFHGMVDNRQKQQYINSSRGLIFPILWDEPFGLCLTESLYYGAPIFGTERGSLPEIITPDVGFLSNDEEILTRHIAESHEYDPKRCHEYAADQYNATVMARGYLAHYEAALNGEKW